MPYKEATREEVALRRPFLATICPGVRITQMSTTFTTRDFWPIRSLLCKQIGPSENYRHLSSISLAVYSIGFITTLEVGRCLLSETLLLITGVHDVSRNIGQQAGYPRHFIARRTLRQELPIENTKRRYIRESFVSKCPSTQKDRRE